MAHKISPPKKSANPRYISTGRKPDIKMGVEQYKPGWMPKEEYKKMKIREAAIRAGIKPSPEILARMEELGKVNKVVAQIKEWYLLHGVMRLSQLNYIDNV